MFIVFFLNLLRFQNGILEFGIWNPASTGVQIYFDFERESGIRNLKKQKMFFLKTLISRGNPEFGIRVAAA